MKSKDKIRIRHTPNCRSPYTATLQGTGFYGWGKTPAEAREQLVKLRVLFDKELGK